MDRGLLTRAGLLLGASILCGPIPANATACRSATCGTEIIYIGTHDTQKPRPPGQVPPGTRAPTGKLFQPDTRPGGKGIYAARFDEKTGQLTSIGLVADVARPTWLVTNNKLPVLYSVSEVGNSGSEQASVYSFAIDAASGALHELNHVNSGGGGATHLAFDGSLNAVFVANFGDGTVGVLPVNPDGSLSAPSSVQHDYGTGPKPRQEGPHAHAVAVDPSHRYVLSADLGADRVFVYRFDKATKTLTPSVPPFFSLPPGVGPRHLAFLPSGKDVYLNTELTAELYAFHWDAKRGTLQPEQQLSLLAPTYTGERSAAEIAASRDGRFIYVSNRGEDSIVVFAVDKSSGTLHEIQRIPAQGTTPWSFTIDPSGRWMIVANEGSSTLNVIKINPSTGKMTATDQSLAVPKPVNVAFFPG